MSKKILLILPLFLLAFLVSGAKAQVQPPDWEIAGCTASSLASKYPALKGTLDKPTDFFSNAVGETVGYSIYLPPSYNTNPTKRYPVVYYLHGSSGNECNYFGNSETQSATYSNNDMVDLVERGDIPETIFIAINGGRALNYNSMVETMFINELIPHIDSKYRTIASREGRAVEGFSMGGFGTAKFVFKYPELFCTGIIMAGADIGAEMESFLFSNQSAVNSYGLTVRGVHGNDQTASAMNDLFLSDLVTYSNQYGNNYYNDHFELITNNAGHNVKRLLDEEGLQNGQWYWSCFDDDVVVTPPPTATPTSSNPSPTPTTGVSSPTPTNPQGRGAGDVDRDRDTDALDLLIVISDFGKGGAGLSADLDDNNIVDIFDYNTVVGDL